MHWKRIVGVITAPDDCATAAAENINSPVGNINSGTFPWSVRSGRARVNLSTGAVPFEVNGLVIVGQLFSGTPCPIKQVVGTLVCNPGEATQVTLDTPDRPLRTDGDAAAGGAKQLGVTTGAAFIGFRCTR